MHPSLFIPNRARVTVPSYDVLYATSGWRRPGLRFYVVRCTGMSFNGHTVSHLLRRAGTTFVATIPLRGEYTSLRERTHSLTEGRALVEPIHDWRELWAGDFRALLIEWNDAHGAAVQTDSLPLTANDLVHASAFADLIERDQEPTAEQVGALVSWLRALGFPLRDWGALLPSLRPVPSAVMQVACAISALWTHLERNPQTVDLVHATRFSPRTLSRLFAQQADWLPASLAQRVHITRVAVASSLLRDPSIRTARIAESLGYGSPRAMLRAVYESVDFRLDSLRGAEPVPIVR